MRVVEVTRDNLLQSPCCGIKNTAHEGYKRKSGWMLTYLKKGLRAKVLLTDKNVQLGYFEYIPGKYAWRAVEADGYMFIHCIWTYYRKFQRKGYGRNLIQICLDDAKKEKMKGVAVVARKKPWLANSNLFLKNGFDIVDTAPPDYQLLVKKIDNSAPNPKFKGDWEDKLKEYGRGLTIICSDQCPHIAKFARDIAETARTTYKLKPKLIELKTHRDAQNAPTPYTAFAIIYNGQLLADHQISRSRFRNIMNKI